MRKIINFEVVLELFERNLGLQAGNKEKMLKPSLKPNGI
jgi:hypothetical protein